jgi:hypothetical protein
MMLAQQGSDAQAYISCSGYGDFYLSVLLGSLYLNIYILVAKIV